MNNLKAYVEFAETYFKQHGFRCNMPLGSYFIRHDTSSLLSYSYDGDIISLDPIHAPGDSDRTAWASFLQAFNDWAHKRGGIAKSAGFRRNGESARVEVDVSRRDTRHELTGYCCVTNVQRAEHRGCRISADHYERARLKLVHEARCRRCECRGHFGRRDRG